MDKPNYKQLCADLVAWAEKTSAHYYSEPRVLIQARAALAEPESASLEQGVQQMQPFVVRHYIEDERPTIKGNGFDGLEIGEDREEAEAFVAWINEKLARLGNHPASPDSLTLQPIPVTERLPGQEDCVVISWSELRSPHVWAGKRRLINGPTEIWDWTFASIPWLEESGEFTHWLPASASVLPAGAIRQSNPSA